MSESLDPFKISQKQLYDACQLKEYDMDLYNA